MSTVDDTAEDSFSTLTPNPTEATDQLEKIVGLGKCKDLLDYAITRPMKKPDFYTGQVLPVRFLALYGPHGVGKRLLITAHAHSLGLTVIIVTPIDFSSRGVFTRILEEGVAKDRGCVVVFDHCEGYFPRGSNDKANGDFRRALRALPEEKRNRLWFVWLTAQKPQMLLDEVDLDHTMYTDTFTTEEITTILYSILHERGLWLGHDIDMDQEKFEKLIGACLYATVEDIHRYCERVFARPYVAIPTSEFRRKRQRAVLTPTWEDFQACFYRKDDGMGGVKICKHDPEAIRRVFEAERTTNPIVAQAAAVKMLLKKEDFPVQT